MSMSNLHRYWFTLDSDNPICRLGVGVTAINKDDATSLISKIVFNGKASPLVVDVVEDVELSTLDQNHIIPNTYSTALRGVWFPMISMGI